MFFSTLPKCRLKNVPIIAGVVVAGAARLIVVPPPISRANALHSFRADRPGPLYFFAASCRTGPTQQTHCSVRCSSHGFGCAKATNLFSLSQATVGYVLSYWRTLMLSAG